VDEGYCVVESNTGELYVGGRSLGFFTGTVSAFITKLSSTGNHIWTRVLQQGIETVSLAATDDGGVTWLAHPQYIEGGPGDYELAWGKFASNGTMLSTKFYGSEGSDNATTFFPMEDGSIAILGVPPFGVFASEFLIITTAMHEHPWATPFLLIALGLSVCFRSNVWNIGAEGQFVIGAIAAGGVALLADKETGRWIVLAILLPILSLNQLVG